MEKTTHKRSYWAWIPSLYFAEGLPYTVVMLLAVVFYKRMGIGNAEIALYTSWLYLPWVIKPLWSPLVDIFKTKRFWIISMQLLIGASLGGVVLTIPMPGFFQFTLGFFWLLAFSSATHDIAADGFYLLALSPHDQSWWVGIRSTFYRLAIIVGQGVLIMLAGFIESHTGLPDYDVAITVKPGIFTEAQIDANYLTGGFGGDAGQILIVPPNLEIAARQMEKGRFDSLQAVVNYWNLNRTRLGLSVEARSEALSGLVVETPGKKVGNAALLYIALSSEPEAEEAVVSFGHGAGDKSINLVSDTRLVFTKQDWMIPYISLIQLDPKLDYATSSLFEARSGNIPLSWSITFIVLAGLFVIFFSYHRFIIPYPEADKGMDFDNVGIFFKNYIQIFVNFFTKEKIWLSVTFILLYRFGEAQLVKIAPLFMLDSIEAGGLALTTGQYGFIYGTIGVLALTFGGILGGIVAANQGLKYWIWWMAIAMNVPNAVYWYLSGAQPDNIFIISGMVAIEQFGYGFGFTAFMLYMITVAEGEHKTAHYALTTGLMALGMMIPGMFSGWFQELIGYKLFFIWVVVATIPGFLLIKFLPINPEFGKKSETAQE